MVISFNSSRTLNIQINHVNNLNEYEEHISLKGNFSHEASQAWIHKRHNGDSDDYKDIPKFCQSCIWPKNPRFRTY